jgi:hypothetical protein
MSIKLFASLEINFVWLKKRQVDKRAASSAKIKFPLFFASHIISEYFEKNVYSKKRKQSSSKVRVNSFQFIIRRTQEAVQ